VFVQLWEWDVARDARGGSVGISDTCHGASALVTPGASTSCLSPGGGKGD
jgi:hypothetical protein